MREDVHDSAAQSRYLKVDPESSYCAFLLRIPVAHKNDINCLTVTISL